jgi:APA family basic amino acid/polyamine antiporter
MTDGPALPPGGGTAVEPELVRALPLALVALYGLGTTIGAGIFVLVGKIAGIAGPHAPLAFLVACVIAGLSAFSFAEMSARFPESAGEAAYVREGLRSPSLAFAVGLLVIAAGAISSAAIVNGFVGYLAELVHVGRGFAIAATVVGFGVIAAIGIAPSVGVAALITVAEIGTLLVVIGAAVWDQGAGALVPSAALIPPDMVAWGAVMSGAVLAFYAFIGFEDIVNVAEEAHDARRTIPRAIVVTLAGTLVLYVTVSVVAGSVMPAAELAASGAPLVAVFERASGLSGAPLAAVAVVSVLNGALIQTIMAARVLYGLSRRGALPAWIGHVNARTRTPVRATAAVTLAILVLALALPIVSLAKTTTVIAVSTFALVNLSLIVLRLRETVRPEGLMRVPLAVPVLGLAASAALIAFQAWETFAG